MVTAGEIRGLLEERPDLEPAIEAVLGPEPPFTFDDVELHSGTFGELVDRGIVAQTEGGYRVADRRAVVAALDRDQATDRSEVAWERWAGPVRIERRGVASLLGILAVVVVFRLLAWPTVFRAEHVVLSGNDPYYYRYFVEQLLASPGKLGAGVAHGEPLLVTSLWLAALVLGGTNAAGGHVMAWYPVVTALVTAALVYTTTVLVTDDRRIGLAAVALLAVLPGHAFRTSLGFADHHPFDFLWLSLTVFAVVLIARETQHRDSPLTRTLLLAVLLVAVGIAAQTLAWDNSPLIIAVLGGYLALESIRSVSTAVSPLGSTGPTLAGLGLAAAIVWTVHRRLGWHSDLVASAPLLLLVGGLGVVGLAEVVYRRELPVGGLVVAEVMMFGFGLAALRWLRPEYWARLTSSVAERLLARRAIAEVQSIFDQSFGWLLLFGFILVLALPYLVWASRRAIDDARWLPPVSYAWYFLGLAAIQARFVGELAPVIVVFAGLGVVHLADRIDVARRPAPFTDESPISLSLPSASTIGTVAVLFLLITGLGMVQVWVKTSQVSTPVALSETAFHLADYSDERGLEYPENYVFSAWGENRVYNYFVSGHSRSYGYAQTHFGAFVASTDPVGWYERLWPRRFVVVSSRAAVADPGSVGTALYSNNGSRTDRHPGLAHYRLIFVSEGGDYKAFELVRGAVLHGREAPNASITARTTVEGAAGPVRYVRETRADHSGEFSLRVAHPGTYQVAGTSVTVSEEAVRNGSVVALGESLNRLSNGPESN